MDLISRVGNRVLAQDGNGGALPTPDGGLALIEYVITGSKQQ